MTPGEWLFGYKEPPWRWPGVRYAMGERPPWYMGLAWRELHREYYILLPIPLNFIARYARDLWYWAKNGGSWPRALEEAYLKGYRTGCEDSRIHPRKSCR